MSLYREARSGRRRLWLGASAALAVAALVAGVAVVLSGGERSPAQQLQSLQEDLRPALDALELTAITYRSPNPTQRAAAAEQLGIARSRIEVREAELRALDVVGTRSLLADLDALATLVRASASPDEVERATRAASARLRAVLRLD